ncbi:hypothetical protein Trco_006384 [Trichoderma cornu-damae]|uniref:Uncharacterized protein n=1 Tax=Trichoderma cornu-damae TaxID=654480 RepID=A0A9P8QLQ9_9HYPO|nr:hypothetical protein Trco_006384 [Trichoderma cornu-damae]
MSRAVLTVSITRLNIPSPDEASVSSHGINMPEGVRRMPAGSSRRLLEDVDLCNPPAPASDGGDRQPRLGFWIVESRSSSSSSK